MVLSGRYSDGCARFIMLTVGSIQRVRGMPTAGSKGFVGHTPGQSNAHDLNQPKGLYHAMQHVSPPSWMVLTQETLGPHRLLSQHCNPGTSQCRTGSAPARSSLPQGRTQGRSCVRARQGGILQVCVWHPPHRHTCLLDIRTQKFLPRATGFHSHNNPRPLPSRAAKRWGSPASCT